MENVVVDNEFLKWLATLGVGGVLAGLMFMFYRKDVRAYTELWKSQSELLIEVVKENTASNVKVVEGSIAQTKLIELMIHLVRSLPHTADVGRRIGDEQDALGRR